MSATTTTSERLTLTSEPTETPIYGKLRYIPQGHTPTASPHNFHLPPISEFGDVRHLQLHDMRPVPTVAQLPTAPIGAAQLSTHGFTAVHHASAMHSSPHTVSSWKDPSLLSQIYLPETESMVKQITGCRTVITETLLLRSALWTESDALATHAGHGDQQPKTEAELASEKALSDLETGFPQFIGFNPTAGGASPAPKIHLDYAPNGARTHIRNYHPTLRVQAQGIIDAEDALTEAGKSIIDHYAGPRWALFSIWRPLKRVRRDPLALGDQRTFKPKDYLPVLVKTPTLGVEGTTDTHFAESYLARWSEGHEWFWIRDQKPEEVLVIGLFDSAMEKERPVAAGGTLHSSVELDGTEGEEARESLELRCIAIW